LLRIGLIIPVLLKVEMSVYPDQQSFLAQAVQGNLIPVWKELLADQETPVSAYERIRAALRRRDHATHTFLLESVEGGEQVGRYSFIGGAPRAVLRAFGRRVTIEEPGQALRVIEDTDPLEALKGYMQRFRPVRHAPELPPFTGGAVGFLGYDAVSVFEPRVPVIPNDPLGAPDMVFMVTDALVVFDRVRNRIRILANAYITDNPEAAYEAAVREIRFLEAALLKPVPRLLVDAGVPQEEPVPESNMRPDQFAAAVERIKEYIRAGDVIQTVLSQRFETACNCDSLDVYRALRAVNPSPYMFLLDMGRSALAGSSPEIHVRLQDGRVQLRPIAGTRPRHLAPEEDARLERELLADPKERAEHVMLVDLGRNDAGRVCAFGSVEVTDLMVIERYSHVMHIVSNVCGTLAPEYDGYDLLRATFPAGTVSGAPKIRAMEIIAELETVKRGPYAGLVGYVDFNGNLDTCITIRTIILDDRKALVQAGAGIVADSIPENEYEETRSKARGMMKALALARCFADAREKNDIDH